MKRLKISSLFLAAALLLGACASEQQNPLVGAWLLTLSSPVGEMASNVDVNPDMTGTMSSPELGSAPIENIVVNDNAVSFDVTIDAQGNTMTLGFTGQMAEDNNSFSGNFETDFGPFPAAAVRR